MFGIDFANIMCIVATLLGFIIIQIIAEYDVFQDYLNQKYDIYSKTPRRLIDLIDSSNIETQKWLEKIEAQLYLLQSSNEEILQAIEHMQSCQV